MMSWNKKQDFPILKKPLVFLDSAASSQKPQCVMDAIMHYYQNDHANIHRGVYELSVRATQQFEKSREKIKHFIHAKHTHEVIFTRGATESINLVANSFGRAFIKKDDEIIISMMEHHSNIVPWQLLCEQTGAQLKIIPVLDNGELDLDSYQTLFSSRTKILAITHASNLLGTINPLKKIIQIAHAHDVPVLVDGAQAIPHMSVNVQDLDCDFYVFSSHKTYGPTGVGILYGKEKWLNAMPPWQGGGDMIESVSFTKTTYQSLPQKFEAGTPNIADVIGFAAAIEYLEKIGMHNIVEHEQQLLSYATETLSKIPKLKIIGTSQHKVGLISFVLDSIHPHDIGTILDSEGIAVRAGHHCAMPLIERFQIPACVRVSFGIYNEKQDIDALISGLHSVNKVFA